MCNRSIAYAIDLLTRTWLEPLMIFNHWFIHKQLLHLQYFSTIAIDAFCNTQENYWLQAWLALILFQWHNISLTYLPNLFFDARCSAWLEGSELKGVTSLVRAKLKLSWNKAWIKPKAEKEWFGLIYIMESNSLWTTY